MTEKPLILAVETSGRAGSVAIAAGPQVLAETAFSAPMRHSAEIFPAIDGLLQRFGRKPEEIEHIYISIGPGSFTGLRIAVTLAKTMHLANAARIVAVDTLDVIASNIIDINIGNAKATKPSPQLISPPHPMSFPRKRESTNSAGEKTPVEKIATILDAKRSQFFIAIYQRQITAENAENAGKQLNSADSADSAVEKWEKTLPDCLMTAPQFIEKFAGGSKTLWLLGEGLVYYEDKFRADGIRFLPQDYWSPRAEKVHLLGWQLAAKGEFADPLTITPNYLRIVDVKVKR